MSLEPLKPIFPQDCLQSNWFEGNGERITHPSQLLVGDSRSEARVGGLAAAFPRARALLFEIQQERAEREENLTWEKTLLGRTCKTANAVLSPPLSLIHTLSQERYFKKVLYVCGSIMGGCLTTAFFLERR